MRESPATATILAALHATRTSARDRQTAMERSIREEARKLRQAEGGESMDIDGDAGAAAAARAAAAAAVGGAAAGRSVIDLDGLVFSQGGHFMSNKGCTLPPGSYRYVGLAGPLCVAHTCSCGKSLVTRLLLYRSGCHKVHKCQGMHA